jgi:hypothetical protein
MFDLSHAEYILLDLHAGAPDITTRTGITAFE